ncbi:hypothetical protein ACFQJD_01610 [Haloplanus sp. GCM10025708]|uniref:hypothetical protein n=1 Tax=Haloferacaceae TaxID=1644056 RepID=UPI00361B4CB7
MARFGFVIVGLVMALVPARVREAFEELALKTSDEVSPRPSFTPAIRAEGVMFVVVSVLGGAVYRVSMYVLGLAGAIALFVPKQALRFSMNIAYENPETVEWKDRLVPVIRGFGVLYLLIALNEVKNRSRET